MAEPIELLFGMVSQTNHVSRGVHIGVTWQIRLNGCAQQLLVGLPVSVMTDCYQIMLGS